MKQKCSWAGVLPGAVTLHWPSVGGRRAGEQAIVDDRAARVGVAGAVPAAVAVAERRQELNRARAVGALEVLVADKADAGKERRGEDAGIELPAGRVVAGTDRRRCTPSRTAGSAPL